MVAYIIAHVNMLVMRKRMPDAPRSFKMPLGPVLPIVGVVGMLWMILTIDPDPEFRMVIWRTVIIALVLLTIYGILWLKLKLKRPLFLAMPVEEILELQSKAEAEQAAHLQSILDAKAAKDAGGGGTA